MPNVSELFLRFRGGQKERQVSSPPLVLPPNLPTLSYKHVLIYMLDGVGPLNRPDVQATANILYDDIKQQRVRPLIEVVKRAGILDHATNEQRRTVTRDRFFNHVGLKYQRDEMEQVFSVEPWKKGEEHGSPLDSTAGSGPARPLLYDLYVLEGLDEVAIRGVRGESETFRATRSGEFVAEALRVIFGHIPLQGDLLIAVGPNGIDPQPHSKSS